MNDRAKMDFDLDFDLLEWVKKSDREFINGQMREWVRDKRDS